MRRSKPASPPRARLDEIGARDGAELGADEDAGALLAVALIVSTLGAQEIARPTGERGEGDSPLLVRLLKPGGLEVFEDHPLEAREHAQVGARVGHGERVDGLVILVDAEDAVGGSSSRP